jgi:Cellulase M and related proteins
MPPISPQQRSQHLNWLLELTDTPTAAGREHRVIDWIKRWVAERPALELRRDETGNLVVLRRGSNHERPLFFTAHLDHPAFVVERVIAPTVVELSFRGGVMDDYFKDARVLIVTRDGTRHPAVLTGPTGQTEPFKHYTAELAAPADAMPGDVGVWDVGPAQLIDGLVHTQACDDLAAAAAALAAMDVLLADDSANAALLFTRAEEIGFVGALAAVRHNTIPRSARLIALENSRSFPDSPIGGGPIVRVGDRISIFTPAMTDAVAARAEEIAGGPSMPTASQKQSEMPAWKWQRKLMAGGACEASVYCHAGYDATCVCLPLGNYHNMADLAAVQAGTNTTPPRVGREFIALSDFEGLVDLLVACGQRLTDRPSLSDRFERLWRDRSFVLEANESSKLK